MKVWTYNVTGRGTFPIDMLRYDAASPYSETDSGIITESFLGDRHSYQVKIKSYFGPPTVARWNSFGFAVTEQKVEKR